MIILEIGVILFSAINAEIFSPPSPNFLASLPNLALCFFRRISLSLRLLFSESELSDFLATLTVTSGSIGPSI